MNQRRGNIWPVSVAPMMDWTDRHFRFFMRQITSETLLYTEMKTTGAILHGDRERILGYSEIERPLALQIGGDDPDALAESAKIAEDLGYSEVNINVGCPSDRVQKGNLGACLMAQPEVVARGVAAMRKAVSIPVTVKHRIGIDNLDRYEDLVNFVSIVAESGSDRFTVHARIALLNGLSPKENRTIPPLRYDDVYRLKEEFPDLVIEINGGIKTLAEIDDHLTRTDGVMLGRAAYENPFLLATADQKYYGATGTAPTRREVVKAMVPYVAKWIRQGAYPNKITRHILGLFAHQPGTRVWKRYLSENAHKPESDESILLKAIENVPDEVLDKRPGLLKPKEEFTPQAVSQLEAP